jgi:hypothetical protein
LRENNENIGKTKNRKKVRESVAGACHINTWLNVTPENFNQNVEKEHIVA